MKMSDLPPPPISTLTGFLADWQIAELCRNTDKPMISPFQEKLTEKGKISYGLSSYGYDVTLAPHFKIFSNVNNVLVDPKNFDPSCYVEREGDYCIIPPNGFVLGHTVEYFNMPEDVMGICMGKSTYARSAVNCVVTPLEPGWSGQLVLEIVNHSPLPAKIYSFEGICQLLFIRGSAKCITPYNARGGKYQGQTGVTLSKILGE